MAFTQVPPNSTGNKIDTAELVDGADTVQRQVVVIGDPVEAANLLEVQADGSINFKAAPQDFIDISFSEVLANAVQSDFTIVQTGTGMTVNQTAGNLVITAGTTANSETIIRSVDTFTSPFTFHEITTLSQRIANNNFYIEFVDYPFGTTPLNYTIVSATSVNVTIAAHGFTAVNVGQRMDIGKITGAAGIPMEAVIASIPDANTIRFTVAGWPGSGSGTCLLWGYNKIETNYTGTAATTQNVLTRRKGWQNATTGVASVTTAAAKISQIDLYDGQVSWSDSAITAATTNMAKRGEYKGSIPAPDTVFYMHIRAKNGTTNPATGTTWTIGMVRFEEYAPQKVAVAAGRIGQGLPVTVISAPSTAVTGSVTATGITGTVAHDAVGTSNPVRIAGRARNVAPTAVSADGDTCDAVVTMAGAQVVRPFGIPEVDWSYAAASGGIVNTSDVALASAAGAGLRRYLTGISVQNASATVATEVVVKDGSTVIWRGYVGTSALLNSAVGLTFPTPLKTTANTALNVACITTASAVYVNAQGYTAP